MPDDFFFLIEKKWPVNAAAREMERSGTSRAAEGKKKTNSENSCLVICQKASSPLLSISKSVCP